MQGDAVKEITELARKNELVEVDGVQYAPRSYQRVVPLPSPTPLTSHTLIGLLDYVKSNRDGLDFESLLITIDDHTLVKLIDTIDWTGTMDRFELFKSSLDPKLPVFPFDTYLSAEDLIIKCKAMFQPSDELNALIAFVSKVTQQNSIDTVDDGVSQVVQVRKGVSGALTQSETTKGMYTLKPYRTFRHIDQPETTFILRLKPEDDKLPKVALFDADGGSWRDSTITAIKLHLESALKEAGIDIPVIA